METFTYKGLVVDLYPDTRKGKLIVWIKVNGESLSFVSSMDTAKRIACNFIDVIQGDDYIDSVKITYYGERKPAKNKRIVNC